MLQFSARPSNSVRRIECRFEQFRDHVKLFGFLNNFQNIQKTEIRKHTAEPEATLTVITIKQSTGGDAVIEKTNDVGSEQLAEELEALKTFFPPISLLVMLCLNIC